MELTEVRSHTGEENNVLLPTVSWNSSEELFTENQKGVY